MASSIGQVVLVSEHLLQAQTGIAAVVSEGRLSSASIVAQQSKARSVPQS
jgi:hypothetical protein